MRSVNQKGGTAPLRSDNALDTSAIGGDAAHFQLSGGGTTPWLARSILTIFRGVLLAGFSGDNVDLLDCCSCAGRVLSFLYPRPGAGVEMEAVRAGIETPMENTEHLALTLRLLEAAGLVERQELRFKLTGRGRSLVAETADDRNLPGIFSEG